MRRIIAIAALVLLAISLWGLANAADARMVSGGHHRAYTHYKAWEGR